ncbi:MAG: HemK/PrmC family methyltransferase [Candidatus Andersenbacteria bacterium]
MNTSSPSLLLRKEKGEASSSPLLTKERLGEVRKHIARALRNTSDAPELDAQRIILHSLEKRDASYLISHAEEVLTAEQEKNILSMANIRKTGMPLAYVLGEADFYGRTFIATQDVLIPRPDTEFLIEKALEYIQNNFQNKKEIVITDLCTGSGIIAITLALELKNIHIIATDISNSALNIAKQNAEQHSVSDRIEFLEGNLLEPIKNKKIDLIVSNPPYVPSAELASLRAQRSNLAARHAGITTTPHPLPLPLMQGGENTAGLLFEPQIALDGGKDGLDFVRQIQEYSKTHNIPAIIEIVGGEIIAENM